MLVLESMLYPSKCCLFGTVHVRFIDDIKSSELESFFMCISLYTMLVELVCQCINPQNQFGFNICPALTGFTETSNTICFTKAGKGCPVKYGSCCPVNGFQDTHSELQGKLNTSN